MVDLTRQEQAAWLAHPETTVRPPTQDVSSDLAELPSGVRYVIGVRTVSLDDDGDVQDTSALSEVEAQWRPTQFTTPATPTATASTTVDGQIDVAWTLDPAVAAAGGDYALQWAQGSNPFGARGLVTGLTLGTYAFPGTTGTSYRFRVRASFAATRDAQYLASDWSGVVTASAVNTKPGAVGTPTLSDGTGEGDIAVTWTAVAGATGYDVRHRAMGTTEWTEVDVGNVTSWSYSGTAGTTYEFQVRATRVHADDGDWSTTVSREAPRTPIVRTPLAVPVGIGALPDRTSGGLIQVSWVSVRRASRYRFRYSTDAVVWTTVELASNTARTALFFGTIGDTYLVQVQAVGTGAYSDSPWSSSASTTSRQVGEVARRMSGFEATSRGMYNAAVDGTQRDTVDLTWDTPPSGTTRVQVQLSASLDRANVGRSWSNVFAWPTGTASLQSSAAIGDQSQGGSFPVRTSATVTGESSLLASLGNTMPRYYAFRVRAYDALGQFSFRGPWLASPVYAAPIVP